ncbi:MAG: MYXO-CTERM domain-containing protein, partial [Planctomycetota bacterium]
DVVLRDDLLNGSLLQLFRRELDLQIQLRFPALEEMSLEVITTDESTGLRYALDTTIGLMQPTGATEHAGFPASGYRASWTLSAERPGALNLQGLQLRFAYTSGFRADTLAGSVAMDRLEAVVHAADGQLQVRDFPEAGRPLEFRGDLGPLTLQVCVPERDFRMGRAFILPVLVQAPGHSMSSAKPSFPRTPDFTCESVTNQQTEAGATVGYLLTPTRSGQLTIPALSLAYFDPGRETYGLAEGAPTIIQVSEIGDDSVSAPGPDQEPAAPGPLQKPESAPWAERLALPLAAVLALVLWRRRASRNGESSPAATDTDHKPSGTPLAHLREALEARINQGPASLTNDELVRQLQASGLPAGLAQAAASMFESLDGERFGGPALADPEAQVQGLLERINQADS